MDATGTDWCGYCVFRRHDFTICEFHKIRMGQ